MTFNGLIKTARPPQRPEGSRPEAAPEPGETAHLAQKDAGSLLFRAGGGLGGPAAARGAGTGRRANPGPGSNKAARDRGKKTEQRGGTPGLQQRCLHRISLRWPGRSTGTPCPHPAGTMGACEGETRAAERDADRHPRPRQASGASRSHFRAKLHCPHPR